jgi:hypothetical protein
LTGRLLITGSKLNNRPTLVITLWSLPIYRPFTCVCLPSNHLLSYLPSTAYKTYMIILLQDSLPRWNSMSTRRVGFLGSKQAANGCSASGFGSLSPPVCLSCCFSTLHQNMWWSLLQKRFLHLLIPCFFTHMFYHWRAFSNPRSLNKKLWFLSIAYFKIEKVLFFNLSYN